MNFYILIPFCSFVIELFMFSYILAQESKNPANRSYLILTGSIILWALCDFIAWSPVDDSWLYPVLKTSSTFWLSLGFVFTNFIYSYLKIKKNILFYLMAIFSFIGVCISLSTQLVVLDAVRFYWGTDIIRGVLFNPFVFLLIIVPFIYSFNLIYNRLKITTDYYLKKQLQFLLYGTLVAFAIGITFDFIIPHIFNIRKFIQPGAAPAVIHSFFIFIAITKYKFFSLGVQEAANDLFSNVNDGIVLLNNNGKIIQINKAAKQILKLNGQQIIENPLQEFLPAYEFNKEYRDFEVALNQNTKNYYFSISQSTVYQRKTSIGKLVILKDITANRIAEQSLAVYAKKLEFSNKELEEFSSIVSHDLNDPLRKIKLNCERIKRFQNMESQMKEYISKVEVSVNRMEFLIRDLLNYSRVTTQKSPFQSVDINSVVKDVVSDLEARILETNGKVEIKNLPVIEADMLQMQQLFQNLIGNALKFHKKETPPIVVIQSKGLENGNVEITVKDNGVGFDEKYLDRIFKPFQRLHLHSEYEGTGMGTAICQKIVERHGGNLTAKSKIGEGTTFIVSLPVVQERKEYGSKC